VTQLNDVIDSIPGDIPDVRQQLSLEYVCNKYGLEFTKEGKAKCPFHEDRRPSFRLWRDDEDVERWHCFPCGFGGDVYDFIGRMEAMGFAGSFAKAQQLVQAVPTDWEPTLRLDATIWGPNDWGYFVWGAIGAGKSDPPTLARAAGFDAALGDTLVQWGVGFGTEEIFGHDLAAHTLWPHWGRNGNLTGCKTRAPDGDKWSLPGSKYETLYGAWRTQRHMYGEPSTCAVIAEGERDTVWAAYRSQVEDLRVDTFGLPRGAQSAVTEDMLAIVRDYRGVYLAFDADDSGETATRLWRHALKNAGVPDVWRIMLPEDEDISSAGIELTHLLQGAV
jgi:hypothetical protein